MAMHAQSNPIEALRLASELERLLLAHGERNWVRGLRSIRESLERPDGAEEAASMYRAMYAGYGSFSDFYLHSEDVGERRRLNDPLDRLRSELWVALGL